jgi:putative tricarboxylic transport membrane protein
MHELLQGILLCFQPLNAAFLLCGLVVGTVFGIVPGLQNITALSILLPFTYLMPPNQAFLLMIGIYVAGIFGGSITAVLYRIPGAPENMATAIDGYAMTRRGKASNALGAAIFASAIGGTVSIIVFVVAAPQLANAALWFGPIEYFALIFFALAMVALIGSSPVKALLSVVLGLLVSNVGLSPITGTGRFTFGSDYLTGGFDVLAVMVGVFAIAEVLGRLDSGSPVDLTATASNARVRSRFPSLAELRAIWGTLLRSTGLGIIVGILPALGATAAALLAYQMERRLAPTGPKFGTGELAGVAAPEAANNASVGGAMIPLMTLGIPGSSSTVIMLTAFQIYGMQPGVSLFQEQKELVSLIYGGMLIANVSLVIAGVVAVRLFSRMANIPFAFLGPAIVILCTIGAYAARSNPIDVLAMFGFGILGFFMEKTGFSISAFVLAFILGDILESSFLRMMIVFDWNPLRVFTHPFAGVLVGAALSTLIWALVRRQRPSDPLIEAT